MRRARTVLDKFDFASVACFLVVDLAVFYGLYFLDPAKYRFCIPARGQTAIDHLAIRIDCTAQRMVLRGKRSSLNGDLRSMFSLENRKFPKTAKNEKVPKSSVDNPDPDPSKRIVHSKTVVSEVANRHNGTETYFNRVFRSFSCFIAF
ncbi:hypothetical protein PGB28_04080 [Primorskyibacter aestuariivivens]|uniref:hypothetical protein n=1 Tax=Primorskyibacter aestuariivivens TaxID=1888912 RepID=UPI002301201A|nr:hypothetical protein [Primorskyibacter aestuariivivens]MDA7427625.1 hypothetical protein [Primorskyibacter aestuariivivens]